MFFMAEAVLLTKNPGGLSHKGVTGLSDEHIIKTGIFLTENLRKDLSDAHDKRLVETADWDLL